MRIIIDAYIDDDPYLYELLDRNIAAIDADEDEEQRQVQRATAKAAANSFFSAEELEDLFDIIERS